MKVAAFDFDYNVNAYNPLLPVKVAIFKKGDKLEGEVLERLLRFNPEHVLEVEVEKKELKEPVKYTEEELVALSKDEQIALLKKLDVSKEEIKGLRFEVDRVNKLLELGATK